MNNNTDPKIQEIKERHAAATPGPWYWHGYLKGQDVDLVSETSGHPTVMGFRRWGMNGAAPAFNKDGAMERIDYGMIETRKPHTSEFYKITHPDADLIKNSWADISYLLSEIERLTLELNVQKELTEQLQSDVANSEMNLGRMKEAIEKIEYEIDNHDMGTAIDNIIEIVKG